jgi:hypothetical protein
MELDIIASPVSLLSLMRIFMPTAKSYQVDCTHDTIRAVCKILSYLLAIGCLDEHKRVHCHLDFISVPVVASNSSSDMFAMSS